MKEIKLQVPNAGALSNGLSNLLKRFSNLEKQILIKLNNDSIESTMSNMQKSVVKFHRMELGNLIQPFQLEQPMYIPLVIADKLTKVLDFFGDSEIEMTIKYDKVEEKDVALMIQFHNSSLNMELMCSKISLFQISMKITDVILEKLSSTEDSLYSIDIDAANISKLKNLASNNINEEIYFIAGSNGVIFKGDGFEYNLDPSNIGTSDKYGFSKNNIKNLDNEDYTMFMLKERSLFKSKDGNTLVVISKLIE